MAFLNGRKFIILVKHSLGLHLLSTHVVGTGGGGGGGGGGVDGYVRCCCPGLPVVSPGHGLVV